MNWIGKKILQKTSRTKRLASDLSISDCSGDMERIVQSREQAYSSKQTVSVVITAFGLYGFSGDTQCFVFEDFFKKAYFDSRIYQLSRYNKIDTTKIFG